MSSMPCSKSYERYVDSNRWRVLEYTTIGAPDISLSFGDNIYLELIYGDRSKPHWRFGKERLPSKHPLMHFSAALLKRNPSVDQAIEELTLIVPLLDPL